MKYLSIVVRKNDTFIQWHIMWFKEYGWYICANVKNAGCQTCVNYTLPFVPCKIYLKMMFFSQFLSVIITIPFSTMALLHQGRELEEKCTNFAENLNKIKRWWWWWWQEHLYSTYYVPDSVLLHVLNNPMNQAPSLPSFFRWGNWGNRDVNSYTQDYTVSVCQSRLIYLCRLILVFLCF